MFKEVMKLDGKEFDEDKLISTLKDAGMDLHIISEFINSLNSGYYEKSKKILLRQRIELLSRIHDGQDKLYCLDYLTRELDRISLFNLKKD